MDYAYHIRRFGSFGNNFVQIQESFFSSCKNLYRSSNKKQEGREIVSFFVNQYFYQLGKNFSSNLNEEKIKNFEKKRKKGVLKQCVDLGTGFGKVK
jgi:hypothetical protein